MMERENPALELLTAEELEKLRNWRRKVRKLKWSMIVVSGTLILPVLVIFDVWIFITERVTNLRHPNSNRLALGLTGLSLGLLYSSFHSGGLMIGVVLADASASPFDELQISINCTIQFSFFSIIQNIIFLSLHLILTIILLFLYVIHALIHRTLLSVSVYILMVAVLAVVKS